MFLKDRYFFLITHLNHLMAIIHFITAIIKAINLITPNFYNYVKVLFSHCFSSTYLLAPNSLYCYLILINLILISLVRSFRVATLNLYRKHRCYPFNYFKIILFRFLDRNSLLFFS